MPTREQSKRIICGGILSLIICVIAGTSLYLYIDTKNSVFTDITPWEPHQVDSLYSNFTDGWGRDTSRKDWKSPNKLTYDDFIRHYYDSLLVLNADSVAYSISKKVLLKYKTLDGNIYDIYEYDFCPRGGINILLCFLRA